MVKKRAKVCVALTTMVMVIAILCASEAIATSSTFSFSVTPGTNTTGAITNYVFVAENPAGYSDTVTMTGTIPAGYRMVPPTSGWQQVGTAELYNGTKLIGKVTLYSNSSDPSGTVDVVATIYFDGNSSTTGTKGVDYSPGGTTSVGPLILDSIALQGSITLPTDNAPGTLNAELSLPVWLKLTKVVITTVDFVQNPSTEGDYSFMLSVNGEQTSEEVPITRGAPPTAVPALTPSGMLALVSILSIVIALATKEGRRK